MAITDYSTSAASNLLLGSIPIGPGMERDKVNNAFQQLMADIAPYSNGIVSVKNVKDFGAVGDGTADDTAAIQAAIDSTSGAGMVYFPKGTYKITDTLEIIYAAEYLSCNLEGVGLGSKIVWAGGDDKPMIHYRGQTGAGFNSFTKISGLYLDGDSFTGGTYSGVVGIQLADTPQDVFTGVCNVQITNCLLFRLDTGILGYYESDQVWISECWIKNFASFGIYNNFGGSGWNILSCHITDGAASSTGIRSSLSVTRVEGCVVQGTNLSVGIQIDGGTVKQGKVGGITNNYFESQIAGAYGVILYGVNTGVLENNTFNGFPGATLIALADVDGVSCNNIRIGNNRHTQSGGFITALVTATAGTTGCTITGKQYTDGAVTTISGPFNFKNFDGIVDTLTEYRANGTKVVGTRDTGWTAMTGTGSKGALAAAAAGTASVGYVQAELQAALNRIAALEARMKSYDAALIAHGLIGA